MEDVEDSDLFILGAEVPLVTGSAAEPLLMTVGDGMESFIFSFVRSCSIGPLGLEPFMVAMVECNNAVVNRILKFAYTVRALQVEGLSMRKRRVHFATR